MTSFALLFLMVNIVSLVWVPYSGVLVDRLDRKKLFLYIIATSGLLVMSIALWGKYRGSLDLWLVGSVFAITFFNFSIHYPTPYAFLQEISEPKHYGRISSILEVQGQSATILAGASAAMLLEGVQEGHVVVFGMSLNVPWSLAAWEIQDIFMLDALTYVVAFLLVYMIQYESITIRSDEKGGIITRLRVGLNYLSQNPRIFLFGVASNSVFVTMLICLFYLYAPYVQDCMGETGAVYANMDIFYGLGAITAGLGIRFVLGRFRLVAVILVLTGLMGLSFVILMSVSG